MKKLAFKHTLFLSVFTDTLWATSSVGINFYCSFKWSLMFHIELRITFFSLRTTVTSGDRCQLLGVFVFLRGLGPFNVQRVFTSTPWLLTMSHVGRQDIASGPHNHLEKLTPLLLNNLSKSTCQWCGGPQATPVGGTMKAKCAFCTVG